MANSVVKSRIASFETHNAEVRSSFSASSPRSSYGNVSPSSNNSHSPPPASTTRQASHNRKQRIIRQRSQGSIGEPPLEKKQPEAGSLMEKRRIAKERRMRRASGGASVKSMPQLPSRESPPSVAESSISSAKPRSKYNGTSKMATSYGTDTTSETSTGLQSNRRYYVHSTGVETRETQPSHHEMNGRSTVTPPRLQMAARRAKMHRMQRLKQPAPDHRGDTVPEAAPSPGRESDVSESPQRTTFANTSSSMIDPIKSCSQDHPTDDEITLTSVRQVVNPTLLPHHDAWETKNGSYDTDDDDGHALFGESLVPQTQTSADPYLRRSPSLGSQMSRGPLGGARDDDDRTFDYGDRDDNDSQGSVTLEQRRRMEAEKRAKQESVRKSGLLEGEQAASPLINKDDFEHFRKKVDTPGIKTAVGVAGAATLGCVVMGPVGLLVGAAVVGIGVGAMQIPEEQRAHMMEKANKAMAEAQESAFKASETMSNSCANTYKDSGVAGHLPDIDFPGISRYCTATDDSTAVDEELQEESARALDGNEVNKNSTGKPLNRARSVDGGTSGAASYMSRSSLRSKKVACLRNVRIVPVGLIHSLDPKEQPRAWLDVMASANTTESEKNEAMEEILILAKDKGRARIFLEEGILDSIMFILNRYFQRVESNPDESCKITPEEYRSAKLAATCALILGKAHCAAIHTEGDLLLMSLYERGTVPEERQLAQMLHEVPHHTRMTKPADPNVVEPSKEIFALMQMSLPQAEELATAIKELADGR